MAPQIEIGLDEVLMPNVGRRRELVPEVEWEDMSDEDDGSVNLPREYSEDDDDEIMEEQGMPVIE